MNILPEEAVKAAKDVLYYANPNDVERALTAALPFLPVQGAVKKLEWGEMRHTDDYSFAQDAETPIGRYIATDTGWFLQGQSGWESEDNIEAAKAAAQADYSARILSALEPSAARERALEKAAHNLINELSGNPGELIDKMAEAIRDWGSHYDDGPWETLPEDRKAGWRGDAERALAVVKEYLTTRRAERAEAGESAAHNAANIDADPSGQWVRYSDYAVLEARLVEARKALEQAEQQLDYGQVNAAHRILKATMETER